jgi:formate--tetrahydrofolate ligase
MKSDIEISRETPLKRIQEIANEIGIPEEQLSPYGKYKAKVPSTLAGEEKGKLILVTAISPTKAGIGKTTTSVGLGLGMARIGKKAIVALREPSLGPCFGMKGGAAGGGHAQVLPMEDINLHFTGDFHAITSANNTLAALLDNYVFQARKQSNPLREILWKRVLDVNDRSLRYMVSGMGGNLNGIPRETGFDITPASEIMAIFCLAKDLDDLRARLDNIMLGIGHDNKPFYVRDLGVGGALVALLKDAFDPNLVQTTENTPAIIHGGPFANIAHGCNSLIATKTALTYADYVITEAGFGADLGAEKFLNIKCRAGNLSPKATVLVATSQALKLHGGVAEDEVKNPNMEGLKRGTENMERHVANLQDFGQKVIIGFNQYGFDTEEEMNYLRDWCTEKGVRFALNNSFSQGGDGAIELAEVVVDVVDNEPSGPINHTYDLEASIPDKIEKVVEKIYGGERVSYSKQAQLIMRRIERLGFSDLPVCIAKTQYSFSEDAKLVGAATGFSIHIRDMVINSGAGFIVAIAGDIMRMPGLPKAPQANNIDLVDGYIEGLS